MKKPGSPPSFSREQIGRCAFDLINEIGIENFSMRELAQKIGISPMGIYTYFPSKRTLLCAVFSMLLNKIDNHPIPEEYWEDTVRREFRSMHQTFKTHPNIRRMTLVESIPWPDHFARHTYQLHMDQGVPEEIFTRLFWVFSSYFTGFIDNEMYLSLGRRITDGDADAPWNREKIHAYTDETFEEGRRRMRLAHAARCQHLELDAVDASEMQHGSSSSMLRLIHAAVGTIPSFLPRGIRT